MRRFFLGALGLTAISLLCSCADSTKTNIETSNSDIVSETHKVNYVFPTNPIAIYDEEGNWLPNHPIGVYYWFDGNYSFVGINNLLENEFYCMGDSIKITYNKAKKDQGAFPYEVVSVERIHTATVEVVSLDEITRNEKGGISSISDKSTEYDEYNAQDSIYIMDKSLNYSYLESYTGDVLYRAIDLDYGQIYYSFDPSK